MQARSFGEWFIERTASLNMTQAEVARHMGVARHTVNRWRMGHRQPEPEMCVRIANAMGIDPAEVLAAAGYTPALNDPRQQAIELVRYLPDERLDEVLRYLRFLVRERG